jgi:hypothetical protein
LEDNNAFGLLLSGKDPGKVKGITPGRKVKGTNPKNNFKTVSSRNH